MTAFYTIGHSSRSLEEFADLLEPNGVRLVVDIRKIDRSRANPQFNGDVLAASLGTFGIDYRRIDALGGRRPRDRGVPREVNAFWRNTSFHNYADYAMTPQFGSGLAELRDLGHKTTCAVMCAEAVWWKCHRRIIADYLIACGEIVFHILGEDQVDLGGLTSGAIVAAEGPILTYPKAYEDEIPS